MTFVAETTTFQRYPTIEQSCIVVVYLHSLTPNYNALLRLTWKKLYLPVRLRQQHLPLPMPIS